MDKNELYRKIPKVDQLLREPSIQELCAFYGKDAVLDAVRRELDGLRKSMEKEGEAEITASLGRLKESVRARMEREEEPSLRPVINATGILLHTNLGRAPLGKVQKEAMAMAAGGYTNLEYHTRTGKRGSRSAHYKEEICRITGAEDAIAVNNNAAAVLLMLSALAKGKEVILSRGELIEIGGRFRIPEVMEQSGAILKEAGCTNRTRISDYEHAIGENTGVLLKVHKSNYRITGFTEEASIEELAALGKKYSLPVLVDLGSGVLVDLKKYGFSHEPTVQEVLKKGADVVAFSGDKLLGGPQAGILAGKHEYIKRMGEHPLMRACRLDKCITAALAATFREYRDEKRAEKSIPVLQMLSRTLEELKKQAEELLEELKRAGAGEKIFIKESRELLGGGALPGEEIRGYALAISPQGGSCERLAGRLRELPVPIISYIKEDMVCLDMRTVLPDDRRELREGLIRCLADR